MRAIVVQGADGCFFDMLRSIEVRLADLKMDDVATLSLKSFCPCQDDKRAFGAETAHRIGEGKSSCLHEELLLRFIRGDGWKLFDDLHDRPWILFRLSLFGIQSRMPLPLGPVVLM